MSQPSAFRRGLESAETFVGYIAQGCLALMMFVVFADVVGRYVFHAPLPWAHELTTYYFLPAVFFLGLPASYRGRAHIAVDILARRMHGPVRWTSIFITQLAVLLFATVLLYYSWQRTAAAYVKGEAFIGWTAWPAWLSNVLVPIACVFLILRTLLFLVNHFAGGEDEATNEGPATVIGIE